MIAAWMLYCCLCALGLSVAAALAERVLLAGRAPVRTIWTGAVVLSLLVPIAAYRLPRGAAEDETARIADPVVSGQVSDATFAATSPNAVPARPVSPGRNWRAALARFDEPLAIAWITLSLALALRFLAGIVALAWMRRRWERRNVLGVPVFVSERAGPAVVGVVAPAIVVPKWVLALEPTQLSLLLRHEEEHRRAGDGRLLTAAELALIAMPWNVALWWQILRLRMAVELDCDARVLRDGDARAYGNLLLEVARPRSGPSLMGATAFAERAAQLERRIRVLARHRVRTSRAARAVAASIALVAVTAAWAAPRPPAPARAPRTPSALPLSTLPVQLVAPASPNESMQNGSNTATTPAAAERATAGAPNLEPPGSSETSATDGVSGPPVQPPMPPGPCEQVDSIVNQLFDGITITSDQRAKACDLLARLQLQQSVQDQLAVVTLQANQARRAKRDAALRELLTNDADRATFDARVAQASSGARSGGAGFDFSGGGGRGGRGGGGDTTAMGRTGGRGARGGGGGDRSGGAGGVTGAARGGGRGGAQLPDTMRLFTRQATVVQFANDLTIRRLFEGITLTPEQESRARALINSTEEEIQANRPTFDVFLRVNPNTGVVSMPAESASALLGLLTNDDDRAKLQSRIRNAPR